MNPALKIIFEKSIDLYKKKESYNNPLLVILLVRPLQKAWLNNKKYKNICIDCDRFSYDSYGWVDACSEISHNNNTFNVLFDKCVYHIDEKISYLDDDSDSFSFSSYTWRDDM